MAENRTVTAIYITEPFLVALDRSRGAKPRSAYLAGLVEQDVDKPGVYDEPVRQVPRSKADRRLTLSLRGEVVEKAKHRRGDLPLATYAASVILTVLDKLERKLAYEDHRRRQEDEAERRQRQEAARQRHAAKPAPKTPTPGKGQARSAPHQKRGTAATRKGRNQRKQGRPVDGRTRVEQRPRPHGQISLEAPPWATWEGKLPPHLQEVEDRLQAERERRRSKPKAKQREQVPQQSSKPASSGSAVSAVEKLMPPPSPSPLPPPSPSTHRGSQEPCTPPEPFGAQEHPMTATQIPPRRSRSGSGSRLIEKPQQDWDHSDLLALLRRHGAGLEKMPLVVPVAALDGEGGRLVHAAMASEIKGTSDSLRVVIGASHETLEVKPLVGPGVVEANWARLITLLESLAVKIGYTIQVTPYVSVVALVDSEDEEEDSDWEWEDEDEDQEDETQEVPCGHVLLASILVASKAGGPNHFPSSSMW